MEIPDISNSELSEKEQKILESAIMIFSEKGFSATTTSEIAKNAGVAEGTIFRYFKTKKDILRGILIQAIKVIGSSVVLEPIEKILLTSDKKDLRETLKELMSDRIKLAEKFFPMARVVFTEALYHDDVREVIYQNILLRAFNTFSIFHQKMLEKGMIRKDIDSETLLRSIMGNIVIYFAQQKLFSDKLKPRNPELELDKMLDVIMFGIVDGRNSTNG